MRQAVGGWYPRFQTVSQAEPHGQKDTENTFVNFAKNHMYTSMLQALKSPIKGKEPFLVLFNSEFPKLI